MVHPQRVLRPKSSIGDMSTGAYATDFSSCLFSPQADKPKVSFKQQQKSVNRLWQNLITPLPQEFLIRRRDSPKAKKVDAVEQLKSVARLYKGHLAKEGKKCKRKLLQNQVTMQTAVFNEALSISIKDNKSKLVE